MTTLLIHVSIITMLRNLLLLVVWYPLAIFALLLNLALLQIFRSNNHAIHAQVSEDISGAYQIAATAGTTQVLGVTVIPGDSRTLLLSDFLIHHDSPMAQYAEHIVNDADKYGLDFRLVAAIAMCESNLGKHIPSKDSHNAWGIAVYTGQQHGANFKDWPTAIDWVSRYLKEKFYDKGIFDLKQIGAIWAPPSVEKGYSWTNCVNTFKDNIK